MMISEWTSLALVINMAVGIPQIGEGMSKNFKYVDATTGLDFEAPSYETTDFTSLGGSGNENKPVKLDASGLLDPSLIDLGGFDHNDLTGRDNDITTHNSFLDLGGSRPMTGDLNMNSNKVIGVATPTAATDAVNKAYADALSVGNRMKGNVAVATTANLVALSGLLTIDGYTLLAGDRVLVKNQTDATKNGIYVAAAGAWSRSADLDNAPLAEILNGVLVPQVLNGTVNGLKPFFISSVGTGTDGVHTINTDNIVWDVFTSPTQLQAGDGIEFVGNIVNVDLAATTPGLAFSGGDLTVDWATAYTDAKAWKASDLVAGVVPIADVGGYTSETFVEGAIQELYSKIAANGVEYTAGASITKGDLVYFTGNNTVSRFPTTSGQRAIGAALTTVTVGNPVKVLANDVTLTNVLTGATYGTVYYWNGTGYQTTIPTGSGAYVWEVGSAADATSLHLDIRYVKRNA